MIEGTVEKLCLLCLNAVIKRVYCYPNEKLDRIISIKFHKFEKTS